MVGGFNHNFKYKGHMYHVQTEDSGVARAHVTTLLYRGGSIIAREVADYRDICNAPDFAMQVESMMKDHHRVMLKNLKDGVFDAQIARLDAGTQKQTVSAPVFVSRDELDVEEVPSMSPGKLDGIVRAYLDAGR